MRDPLLLPGVLLVVGVASWPAWQPAPHPCLLGAALCGLLAVQGRERAVGWAAVGLGALLLGAAAPGLRAPGPAVRGFTSVEGVVAWSTQSTAELDLSRVGAAPARGRLRLRVEGRAPGPGEHVVAYGSARSPRAPTLPGAPDPSWTEALDGVRTTLYADRWERAGPTPSSRGPHPFDLAEHGGLLRSLVLNDRSQLPEEERLLLRDTGTSHLLAISGLHVGILAALAARLAGGLTRPLVLWWGRGRLGWFGALAGVAAAAAFADGVGWPVPAQRATGMLAGALIGVASARGVRPWNLWGLSAGALALWEPAVVRSLSYQLSFGAIAGMMLTTPALQRLLPPDLAPWLRRICAGLIGTLGATLGTLPACALTFQALPLTSPVANLVAIPLMSVVVVPCAMLGATGRLLPTAFADAGCTLTLRWLELTRGPILHPAVGPEGALALALLPALLRRPARAGLLLLLVFGLRERSVDPLRLSVLAVGQGDAALLELGDGRTMLIDGGPPGEALLQYLRRRGIGRVDELLLTHPHPDHMGGLEPVLEALSVGVLRVPRGPEPDEEDFRRLLALARARGVTIRGPTDPTLDPAHMRILHPTPDFFAKNPKASVNDQSLVLELRMAGRRMLFTGDVERKGEAALAGLLGPVDLLKVPHHGSRSSSGPALVQATHPALAVVSCGLENRYGHPHPEVLRRYGRVHRTDRDGTLQVRLRGRGLWFRSWNPGASWSSWRPFPGSPSPPRP